MTSAELTDLAATKIRAEYAMLGGNMDRRDIPCSAYGNINRCVIRELEKNNPGVRVDMDQLKRLGL